MILNKMLEKRSSGNNSGNFISDFLTGKDTVINDNALNNAIYNRCINIYANTVASLPLELKKYKNGKEKTLDDYYLYNLLRTRANKNMSIYNAINTFILLYKHYGIAGLYIQRYDDGTIEGIYPVQITGILMDNIGLIDNISNNKVLIDFVCGEITGTAKEEDIIILRDNSLDGLNGNATADFIGNLISNGELSNRYQNDLLRSGLTSKVAVQMTTDIREDKKLDLIQEKFERLYNNNTSKRIFLIPAGFNVSPLNLSLADSQFMELKKVNSKDICIAMGIPTTLIEKGVLTENEIVSFLTFNISPIVSALEQELNYKLLTEIQRKRGIKIRFNINKLLRTDTKKQQEILCEYVKNGIYTTNDARAILGLNDIEGANILLYPSGQVTLENLINKETAWTE